MPESISCAARWISRASWVQMLDPRPYGVSFARVIASSKSVNLATGSNLSQAVSVAQSADVAIVMVGDDEAEGTDHPISLSGNQDQLVQQVAAANPHTIVVMKSGSAILMPWVGAVPAILEAWYPGEEDGNAVAAVLFGDVRLALEREAKLFEAERKILKGHFSERLIGTR